MRTLDFPRGVVPPAPESVKGCKYWERTQRILQLTGMVRSLGMHTTEPTTVY